MSVGRHDGMRAVLEARAANGAAITTAVVHPVDAASLFAAVDTARRRRDTIVPVLIEAGSTRIGSVAEAAGADISGFPPRRRT